MAVRVESPQLSYTSETNPGLERFLADIAQPLAGWSQATGEIVRVEEKYKGPNGLVEEYMQGKFIPLLQGQRSKTGDKVSDKEFNNIVRRFKIFYLKSLDQETDLPFYQPDQLPKMQASLAGHEAEQIGEQFLPIARNYRQEMAPLQSRKIQSQAALSEKLSDYLASDFNSLLVLSTLEDEKAADFWRFLAGGQMDLIKNSVLIAAKREFEKPNPQRLTTFFDEIGMSYYSGRKDTIWPWIQLALAPQDDEIEALYSQPTAAETRQQYLFGDLSQRISSGEKTLPQILREKYASFLAGLQEHALVQLSQKANRFKLRELTEPPPPSDLEESQQTTDIKEAGQKLEKPSKVLETSKDKKTLIINGQIVASESAIREQLEQLFKNLRVGDFKSNDLDSYCRILAKLAGERTSAPSHRLDKLKVLRVPLSDGSTEPVYKLRLNYKGAPRIFLVFHSSYIIVIAAAKRDDTYYDQKMQTGFPPIDLPQILRG